MMYFFFILLSIECFLIIILDYLRNFISILPSKRVESTRLVAGGRKRMFMMMVDIPFLLTLGPCRYSKPVSWCVRIHVLLRNSAGSDEIRCTSAV
jgi:hypothetical protein